MRNLIQNFILRKCEKMIAKNFPRSFFALGVDDGNPFMMTGTRCHDFNGWWDLIKFAIRGTPRRRMSELTEKIWFFNLILTAAVAMYALM